MTERPILFSGPMVRAILDGRKSQTRRVVARANSTTDGYGWSAHHWGTLDFSAECFKDGNPAGISVMGNGQYLKVPRRRCECGCSFGDTRHRVRCRTEPGDRLWVRETHYVERAGYEDGRERFILYRATDDGAPIDKRSWTPSIFMPRWASRITLEVTGVRVERVQEIAEVDAGAEGVDMSALPENASLRQALGSNRNAFRILWDSINGKRPGCAWADNPWVWVVEFKREGRP